MFDCWFLIRVSIVVAFAMRSSSGKILVTLQNGRELLATLCSIDQFGRIPSSLTQLKYLVELHLENNQFSGVIPPFQQPSLLWLDVSNNNLQGEIPPSLSKFDDSVFDGNPNLCGERTKKDCNQVQMPQPTSNNHEVHKKKSSNGLVIGIGICVIVLLLIIIIVLLAKRRKDKDIPIVDPAKKGKKAENSKTTASVGSGTLARSASSGGSGKKEANGRAEVADMVLEQTLGKKEANSGVEAADVALGPTLGKKEANGGAEAADVALGPTLFPNNSNSSSTNRSIGSRSGRRSSVITGVPGNVEDLTMINKEKGSFGMADLMRASAEVLGNGGMGSAYKAVVANGLAVAIKRMKELNRLDKEEFGQEVQKLARLKHENVLPPLAYYYRKEEKLLVYEYVSKGSLHHLLHGERGPAHAELTWPVRLKIIEGVARGLQYIHKQLSTNELPHGNLKSSNILINAKHEPLISDYGFDALASPSIKQKAMFGYRSPEAGTNKVVSPKCDIYCLGVVILEILTGKFPCQYLSSTKNGTDVVQWTMSAINEGRETGLLDPDMMPKAFKVEDGMIELLHVGVECAKADPGKRPCLDQIVERIERVQADRSGRK